MDGVEVEVGMGVVWEVAVRRWVVGGAGTQHSEKGKRRWQVEVRAEQFSTVGVEVRREALGVEGGAEARVGITVVKETVILPPQAWTVPTILHGSLLSISPNRRKSFE